MPQGDTGGNYVDVPMDLQVALAEHASAMSAWRGLTPQQRQAHVADLESAAGPEARTRCLSSLISDLEVSIPSQSRR